MVVGSLLFSGWRCVEDCRDPDTRPSGWGATSEAWQWTALWVVPLVALALTVFAGVLAMRLRNGRAAVAAGGAVVLAGVWVGLVLTY